MAQAFLGDQARPLRLAIFGISGAIGGALAAQFRKQYPASLIYGFARDCGRVNAPCTQLYSFDLSQPDSISSSIKHLAADIEDAPLNAAIIATGQLHSTGIRPEKRLEELNSDQFNQQFAINCTGPALIAQQILPLLDQTQPSLLAAISARVGSISDNQLGGWYSYRAAKAALNMVLKSLSIEAARRYQNSLIIGLHPGTVDSALSQPFSRNVKSENLFSSSQSAAYLYKTIQSCNLTDSGKIFAWDGQEIHP